MTNEASPWAVKSSRITYQNPWMRIREDSVITPAGKNGIYGVVESNDTVKIIVLNDLREIYLVRVFRYPSQLWSWEMPGGGGDRQETLAAAKRELFEETGITATGWQKIGNLSVCDGLMTQRQTTFLAIAGHQTSLSDASGEGIQDGGFYPLGDVNAMVDDGRIISGEAVASLMLYSRWLAKQGS